MAESCEADRDTLGCCKTGVEAPEGGAAGGEAPEAEDGAGGQEEAGRNEESAGNSSRLDGSKTRRGVDSHDAGDTPLQCYTKIQTAV